MINKRLVAFLTIIAAAASTNFAQQITAPAYVYRSQLSSRYRQLFSPLGNRLEARGKERLIMTATLSQLARGALPVTVVVTTDSLGQLRVDFPTGTSPLAIVFDGSTVLRSSGTVRKEDLDLAESLIQDSVEYFLRGFVQGNGIRQIAHHGSLDGGTPGQYDGYQVVEHRRIAARSQDQLKAYWFASDTNLLRSVFSQSGSTTIETRFTDWRAVQRQLVPHLIERFENGTRVMSLSVLTTTVAPRVSDTIFNQP
jgi:hypothetical protein